MLFFNAALLLAASCLLVHVVSSETVTTCEETVPQRLSCELGVISVQTALYGRTDSRTCGEARPSNETINTSCSLGGVVHVIRNRCNGKKVCELIPNTLGSDPCIGTAKYLRTTYTCLQAIHSITCENSLAHLQCAKQQRIIVYGADYGRRDRTTCGSGRSDSQLKNTACSNPTSQVSKSCDGKNSCIIKASNSVFGDPCEGIYKYLEVAYFCRLVMA